MTTPKAHPRCLRPDGHTCQNPSGRACVDCGKPAGTLWGPLWCPECDADRLNRISGPMESLLGHKPPEPIATPPTTRTDEESQR